MAPEVSAVIEGFVFRLGFHVFMSPCVDMQAFVSFAYEFPEWSMSCLHVISIRSSPLLTCPIKGTASCHVPIYVRKLLRDGWDDPRRTCFIVSHPNVVVPQMLVPWPLPLIKILPNKPCLLSQEKLSCWAPEPTQRGTCIPVWKWQGFVGAPSHSLVRSMGVSFFYCAFIWRKICFKIYKWI